MNNGKRKVSTDSFTSCQRRPQPQIHPSKLRSFKNKAHAFCGFQLPIFILKKNINFIFLNLCGGRQFSLLIQEGRPELFASLTATHGLALSIPPSDPSGSSMASRAGLQRGMEKPPSPETSRESSTNGPWCRGPRRRGGLTHSPQSQLQPHQQEAA